MNTGKTYAYVRVSTKEQNEDRQLMALKPYDIPHKYIFMDKQSGKNFDRPAYNRMIRKVRSGDLILIKSIDRLGRNYEEIIEQWRYLTKEKKVDIRILDMPLLDTTYGKDLLGTFISDLVLQVLSFSAQNEREMIRQRQAEGIQAAHARGKRWGRKSKEFPKGFELHYNAWKQGTLDTSSIIEISGMKRTAFYKHIKEFEKNMENINNKLD